MRIAIVGGGPGGLYFAALMRGLDADHEVTVWERNAPDDTFGFGVVFSDETLGAFEGADPVEHEEIERSFARWTDIDIALTDGSGPDTLHRRRPGLLGAGRKELLNILQQRGPRSGVTSTTGPRRRITTICGRVRPGDRRRRAQQP
jgi:anthraniloyl-CoA monooxygenase